MVHKSCLLLCVSVMLLGGCIGNTHSSLGGRIWMQQNSQKITSDTVTIIDVGQEIFSPMETAMIEERRQKRMDDASKPPAPPPLNLDERQLAEEHKKQDDLFDYLALNRRNLRNDLIRDFGNNGISVVSAEDVKNNPVAYAQKPKLMLKVYFSQAESGKRHPDYIAAGLGSHELLTTVTLLDQRAVPAKECLRFDVKVSGWKPGVSIAPKWNLLHRDGEMPTAPDADKTAHEIVPVIVEYFVKQHWLEASFAPDYPQNQNKGKSWRDKIFFWRN